MASAGPSDYVTGFEGRCPRNSQALMPSGEEAISAIISETVLEDDSDSRVASDCRAWHRDRRLRGAVTRQSSSWV